VSSSPLSGGSSGSHGLDQVDANGNGIPIRLLHDRVLVQVSADGGDRRSTGGILIPATAQIGHRLSWAEVVGVGQHVRSVETGERVLFDPEGKAEIELHGVAYTLLRERDLHAVASPRVETGSTGLYL
jgi:chaperonin GroES